MKTAEEIIKIINEVNNELFHEFGTDSYATRCKINDIKEYIASQDKWISDEDVVKQAKIQEQKSYCEPFSFEEGAKWMRDKLLPPPPKTK